jgi:large subunit ribosomal protein L16
MLQPKRTKFRKQMKGRNRGLAQRGNNRQLRRVRAQGDRSWPHHGTPDRGGPSCDHPYVKRGGKIWIRVFPDKPITKKPLEVRHG